MSKLKYIIFLIFFLNISLVFSFPYSVEKLYNDSFRCNGANFYSYVGNNTEDISLRFNSNLTNTSFPSYKFDTNRNWLNNEKCEIISLNFSNDALNVKSNFAQYPKIVNETYFEYNSSLSCTNISLDITDLKKYYYMKTFVFAKVEIGSNTYYFNPDHIEKTYYTFNRSVYNQKPGTTESQINLTRNNDTINAYDELERDNKLPYVLLKPGNNDFTFDIMKDKLKNECSEDNGIICNYNITYYAIPIDGKCDFNINDTIDRTEFQYRSIYEYNYILDHRFDGSEKKIGGKIEYDDKKSKHKIRFDPITNISSFINSLNDEEIISLPENRHKSIKIYKNNALIRSDEIIPEMIALVSHKIKNLKNVTDAQIFINLSYNFMNNFNISKYIDKSEPSRTKIKINLTLGTSQIKNLTLYQVIPKPYTYKDITFINDGGGQRFVLDKDPVIGWYFNESSADEVIEYSLPGETEGGVIIVTQEPILFNEGDLVINYRENNCEEGEVSLFELDSLEDSKVYSSLSGKLYSVCIAHLTEKLYNTKSNLYQHIFNFKTGGNVSLNSIPGFLNETVVSIKNTTPIYWDLKIQKENPTGDYSCLGSVNNLNNSLFGDCGYNSNNRIWLHLGPDLIPPTTTLSFPYLTHSAQITLNAEDNIGGSGLKQTKYCVDSSGNCSPNLIYSNPFTITCVDDWGCDKYVKFFSEDLEKNTEDIQNKKIRLLDKGNSCNDDCTAKPSPNRYLSECRNLAGCRYFETNGDEGKYVAEKCNFMTPNSWVKYNSTHDIKCPMGPFRKSQFTNSTLYILDSLCENIIKTPYPVILNGEQIIMNILTCINPY